MQGTHHKSFIGHKHFCPCLPRIASRLPREESGHCYPYAVTPFQKPFRCSQLLAPQDFQSYFYSLGKTMNELLFKISSKTDLCVLSLKHHIRCCCGVLPASFLTWDHNPLCHDAWFTVMTHATSHG